MKSTTPWIPNWSFSSEVVFMTMVHSRDAGFRRVFIAHYLSAAAKISMFVMKVFVDIDGSGAAPFLQRLGVIQ